jgi:hypothetical protein
MQFRISTEKDIVTVHADVTRIEVEDIVSPGADEHYFRTIRFVGNSGEAIEVFCSAYDNKNVLTLHRVKKLTPVKTPKPCNWLVYTGNTSDENEEQESD